MNNQPNNQTTGDANSTLLIIDDDNVQLKILSNIFKSYQVITAANGQEGLDKALENNPDLIILDIEMPDANGYEICTKFRTLEQTKSTPIVFYSALSDADSRSKAYNLGGNDYITKDGHPEVILTKVKQMLSSEQERTAINNDADASSKVMLNLQRETSRMHVVSQFLQACQYCHDSETLGKIFLNSLKKLHTRGLIFFKSEDIILSSNGTHTKLEVEIFKSCDDFGRIHSFQGSRVLFNWKSIVVLVKDIGEMIDTIAYFMDAVENSYHAMNMQTKLIDQVIRIESENIALRKKLSSTTINSKESLKEKLYTTGLLSRGDIQDEKDLDDILEPYGDDLSGFLSGMDNNSQNIKRLLRGLKTHPADLDDYFRDPSKSPKGEDDALF